MADEKASTSSHPTSVLSTPPPPSVRTRPPKSAPRSGEFPAVQAYRSKLQSISDHEGLRLDSLDPELDSLLAKVTGSPKPKGAP